MKVRIGATNRNQQKNVLEANVLKVITHNGYEPAPLFHNDIALLRLESRVRTRSKQMFRKLNLENVKNLHSSQNYNLINFLTKIRNIAIQSHRQHSMSTFESK